MTHIKLMIDHNFGKPVADELNKLGAVKAKTIVEYGFKPSAEDHELIKATSEHNCILLTFDKNTINEAFYPPCHHGGIIIVKNRRWFVETVFAQIKALCLSGYRGLTAHHVTHLYDDRAVILTHDGIQEIKF